MTPDGRKSTLLACAVIERQQAQALAALLRHELEEARRENQLLQAENATLRYENRRLEMVMTTSRLNV